MAVETQMKPCPFCAREVVVWDTNFGTVQVIECKSCDVRFVFKWNAELSEVWNRRSDKNDD